MFADFFGCRDITDTQFGGFSFNSQIQAEIQTDDDLDTFLDRSYVLEFKPFDATQVTPLVFGTAPCTSPMATTVCGPMNGQIYETTATPSPTVDCLTPLAGTLRPYAPAIVSSTAPCFGANLGVVTINLAGIPLTLREASIGATTVGSPPTSLVNGMIRGFVSEADADNTIIPTDIPLVGGRALSALLPGGDPAGSDLNCAAHTDKDINNGVTGWWFYLNFPAARLMAPSAADASISGRVTTSFGRAIGGAHVTVQDINGTLRSVPTNTFGYFAFNGLTAGESYIVSVSARRYRFDAAVRAVNLIDSIGDLNFVSSP